MEPATDAFVQAARDLTPSREGEPNDERVRTLRLAAIEAGNLFKHVVTHVEHLAHTMIR